MALKRCLFASAIVNCSLFNYLTSSQGGWASYRIDFVSTNRLSHDMGRYTRKTDQSRDGVRSYQLLLRPAFIRFICRKAVRLTQRLKRSMLPPCICFPRFEGI